MELKLTHIACAAALAAFSSASWAVAPGSCAGTSANFDIDVYLAGASAVQNSLGGVISEILNPGFTVVYDNGTSGTKGSAYRAYCGTLNATTGALAGKKVRFLDRARGGSVWGVNPVARDQAIATLNFADAACAASATAGVNFECSEIGNDLNAATAGNRKPDFGISDVEPQMFKDPINVEFGQNQLSATELAKVTGGIKSGYQVIFGPAVTLNVNLSDLSRTQVASLLTGQYVTWDQAGSSLNTPVTVCRRVQGSGTQAAFNQYFLNFPCGANNIAQSGNASPTRMTDSAGYGVSGTGASQADPIVIDPSAGPTTVENPASGDVRSCLINAQNGTDYAFKGDDGKFYRIKFSAPGGPYGAIGVLSLDSKGNTGFGTQWKFAKLNGIDPTVQANAQMGLYDFVFENTFQRNSTKVYPNPNYTTFINLFIQKAQSESILRGIANVNVRQSLLALPTATNPVPSAANITSKWTRSANSCKAGQFVY
ncbi:MAG: hypothetical protein ABI612_09130 [Betaproteobacteria bacterium]